MERNYQRPTQRSSNHKKNIPEVKKKNTRKASSSQRKGSSEKTIRNSMERGRKPATRRRPVGLRDPRAARRAAMRRKRRRANIVFIIILLILLFLLIRWAFARKRGKSTATSDTSTPTTTTEATVRRDRVLFRKPAEIIYAIGEKPIISGQSGKTENYGKEGDTPTGRTYQEDFRKDIFVGNSILDELQYYRYIYPDNSVTKIGLNVQTAVEYMDEAVRRRPERVFLYFGTNEANGQWETENYINDYRALVSKFRHELPKSKIYVMSILPVDESLAAAGSGTKNLKNETIRSYNDALQTMAQEEGIEYIDLYKIENLSQYHEQDGIHFQAAFGGIWAQYILEAVTSAAQ